MSGGPRARKRFGQHFLVDRGVVERICALVRPRAADQVLEVGPGRGALTEKLLALAGRLVAVEIDRDLAAALRRRLERRGLHLIEGDVLQVDLGRVAAEAHREKLLIVGNVPYNITAPLLFRLLEEAGHIREAVLMFQREVARRLLARPGSRDYGLLTVLLGMRVDMELCLEVPNSAFRPVPRVHSSVVALRFRERERYPVRDGRLFGLVVRRAFAQRRKMLRNALKGMSASAGVDLEEVAGGARIDLRRRAETLSVEEFGALSDAFVLAAGEKT